MKQKITLDQFNTQIQYPVQWSDMDAARHVNNLVYLRWAEYARLRYFELMGLTNDYRQGVDPIISWQDCKHIFPMTYPDTALVGVRTITIAEDRFTLETAIFSKRHERIAALSRQTIVPYDYSILKKALLPSNWIKAIKKMEGWNENYS